MNTAFKLLKAILAISIALPILLVARPAFAEDEVLVDLDVNSATSYELTLQMRCSGINQANAMCEVYPTALSENGFLEGKIKLAVCIYINESFEKTNCYGVKAKSTSGKGPSTSAPESVLYYELELGQTSNIKVKNYTYGKNLFQEVVIQDSKSLADAFDGWEGSGKKDLVLTLSTANMVLLGETKSYKITSKPKVTGTCSLYRYLSGVNTKVASVKLKNGTASGKLRWLWTTSGQTVPMTLKAVCENSSYAGEKYTLVSGIRK